MKSRQGAYLNVILTVNAVLLSVLIWTQIASRPVLEQTAEAQSPPRIKVPNAADQRQKMIKALNDVKKSVDSTRKLLEGGKLKVRVTNLDEIELEGGQDR